MSIENDREEWLKFGKLFEILKKYFFITFPVVYSIRQRDCNSPMLSSDGFNFYS